MKKSFDPLGRAKTIIHHGLQSCIILPQGSSRFVEQELARDLPFLPVKENKIAPASFPRH